MDVNVTEQRDHLWPREPFDHRIGSFTGAARSLHEVAQKLRAEAAYLECMTLNGYELAEPVRDGHVVARRRG